ncbi:tetratricopeptide repeat protein [Pseudomonas sp. 460]|uniref:tetratricopeptide repeat protein n=1 Tax=Pseudomonas sp. 460 TaxID=2485142 RepID=UPI0010DA3EA3|nr:tetratricopeptide repeat protein [Pseudomonas sp. 460]TCV51558.1 Sel1 repeat-containing protein [Pseudomonas sp. 460]
MRLYSALLIALMLVGCDKPPTLEQGMYFYTQSQHGPAVSALQPYADEGDYRAQLILGMAYIQKDFRDDAKSAHYFKLAADQGDVDAMYFLGRAYLDGKGVPQNTTIGESYLIKASEAGSVAAFQALGNRYADLYRENNSSVEALKAIHFYERAFLLGEGSAALMISITYGSGSISNRYLSSVWNGAFQLTQTNQKRNDAYQFLPADLKDKAMMDSYALYSKFSSMKPAKSFLDEIGKYRKPAA